MRELTPNANILCHQKAGPMGVENVEFEWQGGDVAMVDRRMLQDTHPYREYKIGQTFWIGPLRLRVLDIDYSWNGYLVMRDGFRSRLMVLGYGLGRHFERSYRRLILTLAIWGLARWHEAAIPHWRDVYALDRIAKRMGR